MSDASKWDTLEIEAKVTEILQSAESHQPGHPFGRPFVTAYQLAIVFASRYEDAARELGLPVGGVGTGTYTSLAQYLARELSRRINSGRITHIEGAFLWRRHVREIAFDHQGQAVRSSLGESFDLSMFRIIAT